MSTRSLLLAMSLFLGGGAMAAAQIKASLQIEAKLEKALNSPEGSTTMGMVQAFDTATKAYASEIGRIYSLLEKALPTNQRSALVQGQLAWQEYFKTQRMFVSYVYDADGTIHKPMAIALLKETLKHRLEELCGYFLRDTDELSEDVPGPEFWCKEKHESLGGGDLLVAASQAARPKPAKSGQK